MARDSFTILLNLEEYFSDDRQRAKIYIDQKYSKISDLEEKISEIFGIKRFHLLSGRHFLPPSEDIALIKNGETVSVKPNISPSRTNLLSDAFYSNDNTSDNNAIISEHTSPMKSDRTNKLSYYDKKVGEEATALAVEEKELEQIIGRDCHKDNECRLHTSTPDTSNGPYFSLKRIHEREETNKKKETLKKKCNDNVNNNGFKLTKSKKRKHKKLEEVDSFLEEVKTFLKEGSQGHTESRNEEFLRKELKNSQVNLVQNKKLKTDKKSIETNAIENEHYSRPIPYKKARNPKSWSNSPLPKTTNIVKIIKIPIDKIEIDNTRFVYIPDDNLPPLEPIVVEMKNMNTSAVEFNGDISMKSHNFSDKSKDTELQNSLDTPKQNSQQMQSNICPEASQQKQSLNSYNILKEHMKSPNLPDKLEQNIPDVLQNDIESSKSQNSLNILEQIESQNFSDSTNPNLQSQNILDASQRMNSEIRPDQSQLNIDLTKSQNFSDKSAAPIDSLISEISQQAELQKYCIESKSIKSQNCLGELQCNTTKQHINSQSCTDHNNIKLIQSPNFANTLQQTKSQNSTEVSQQSETQNLLHSSQPTNAQNSSTLQISSDTAQNDSDISTITQQLNSRGKPNNLSNILSRIAELSQCDMKKSRSKSRERWRQQIGIHSGESGRLSNLNIDASKTLDHSSLCHNTDEKYAISETNGKSEGSLETDPINVEYAGEIFSIDSTKDRGIELSTEISRPTDNIAKDTAVPHETITDIENFPEPKRKRKRRYRKKKKVESEIPRQETMNAYPSKWVPYIPAKPKIHLRFDSSEDDISVEKDELNVTNVANNTATPGEKIKILQDVTINPDTNSLIDHVETEGGIGSSDQNELFSDRCGNTGQHFEPVGFSNNIEDFLKKLLQMKKEQLLKSKHSITSAND